MTSKRNKADSVAARPAPPGKPRPYHATASHKPPRPSIRFAQNFLRDPNLVAQIVSQAGLDENDVVYEIGPGQGIITRQLAEVCAKVIAIEVDRQLFEKLK